MKTSSFDRNLLLSYRKENLRFVHKHNFSQKIINIWLFWSKIVKIWKNLFCNTFKYQKKVSRTKLLGVTCQLSNCKKCERISTPPLNFFHVKILWNRNVVQLKSSMNSVIWREFSVNLIDKWIWREKSVKMMMPMEDIPSPRTAGEFKQFGFLMGICNWLKCLRRYFLH